MINTDFAPEHLGEKWITDFKLYVQRDSWVEFSVLVLFGSTVSILSLRLWYNIQKEISNISWSYMFEIRERRAEL